MEIGQQYVPYNLFNSVFIPDGLMRHQGITLSAKVVFAVLNKYAGQRGFAWPSTTEIAEDCAINKRSVLRAIAELETHKLIKRVGVHHKRIMWAFLWHPCLECSVKKSHRFERGIGDKLSPSTMPSTDSSGIEPSASDKMSPSSVPKCHPTSDKMSPSYNKVPSGSCNGSCNGSLSTRESESPPERPPGDEDEVRSLFILLAGRVDFVDFQNLDYFIEDHGRQNVLEAMQKASIGKVRGRGVLPYVKKVLENQGKVEANGGIDPDRDNWR